jgi:uncharacterized protein (TIGR00730 family)
MPSIAVFCGARAGANARYAEDARALGKALAERGWPLVYGGGRVGLMGVVAQGCLDAGGEVTGVIPGFLSSREVLHPGLQVNHQVEDLFERKGLMIELADGFIALPGGIGTLDELLEVMAWRQLGCIDKPIALLNTAGYFAPWLEVLRQAVKEGFLDQAEVSRLMVHDRVDRLLEALEENLPLVAAP